MTRVSIVSAFYNRADYVADSVRSLLDQTHADLEIILADDGSTDGTLAELRRFDDPRLTVIGQDNAGFVTTMNRMIARATGDYIAVHGSGDLSLPDRVAKQAALLDANPGVGVVSCFIRARDETHKPAGWDQPLPVPLRAQMIRFNPFSHGEIMFRKNLFDQVGGYRPLFRFAQDRDLWLRMGRLCGYGVVPEALYERYNLPGSVSRSPDKVVLQKKLASFAVDCAHSVDAQGRDMVDRHGELALLLAERNPTVGRQLARLGLGFVRRGDVDGGKALLHAAARESNGPIPIIAGLLSRLPSASPLWRLLNRKP